MKKTYRKCAILIVSFLCLFSCNKENDQKRNVLEFDIPYQTVENAILEMTTLLKRLPTPPNKWNKHYEVTRDRRLIINGEDLGKLNLLLKEKNYESLAVLQDFNASERDIFINLVKFLYENHISSCFESAIDDKIFFDYKRTKEDRYDDVRVIFYLENTEDMYHHKFIRLNKVLDKKGRMVLVSYKR